MDRQDPPETPDSAPACLIDVLPAPHAFGAFPFWDRTDPSNKVKFWVCAHRWLLHNNVTHEKLGLALKSAAEWNASVEQPEFFAIPELICNLVRLKNPDGTVGPVLFEEDHKRCEAFAEDARAKSDANGNMHDTATIRWPKKVENYQHPVNGCTGFDPFDLPCRYVS